MFDRLWTAFDRLLVIIAALSIFVMLGVTVVSVIGRYFFSAPIPDDIVINELLIVVLVFLPFAYVQRHDQHVFVTLITDNLSPGKQKFLITFGTFIGLAFFILVSYATWLDFAEAWEVKAYNEGLLELPEYPSRFAVFLGVAAMTVRLALDLARDVRELVTGDIHIKAQELH